MRLDLTKIQVSAVAAMLRDMLAGEPDDQLLADMLEAETDLYEMSRRILDWIEDEEGDQASLKTQIEDRQSRKQRSENRVVAHRQALMALLECAGLDKLTLPEATVSVRKVAPKPIVVDEAALPDELCRFSRKPDMAAIKAEVEAGRAVSGVSFDNGGISLTVRRK